MELKNHLEEGVPAQMINFEKKYCELEREIGERDDEIKQLRDEINRYQLNESKNNMKEKLMEISENEMSPQEATCLVYLTFETHNNNNNIHILI